MKIKSPTNQIYRFILPITNGSCELPICYEDRDTATSGKMVPYYGNFIRIRMIFLRLKHCVILIVSKICRNSWRNCDRNARRTNQTAAEQILIRSISIKIIRQESAWAGFFYQPAHNKLNITVLEKRRLLQNGNATSSQFRFGISIGFYFDLFYIGFRQFFSRHSNG